MEAKLTTTAWLCEKCGKRNHLRLCLECRNADGIRTPIEESRYGYPVNPPTHPNAGECKVRHVTGNQ
jgi:hypothetical protein